MYIEDGPAKNYFAWSCQTNGKRNAEGPAPDGEEYFAMALFFASKRWGDGDGIFCYSKEAQNILRSVYTRVSRDTAESQCGSLPTS